MDLLVALIYFSGISFLFFGISCFFTPEMKVEFERYGVPKFRKLVGLLQIIGAAGLIFGYVFTLNYLAIFSAFGLSLLMVLGFGIRLKIKDSFLQSAPSFIYAILNSLIALKLCQAIV